MLLALVQGASGAADFWDLPPIRYSDTKVRELMRKDAAAELRLAEATT